MSDEEQKKIFISGEGDAWFARNRMAIEKTVKDKSDPVLMSIKELSVRPRDILEVGCANGWRLDLLAREYGAKGTGIDPSEEAITDGRRRFPALELRRGTADTLSFADGRFDLLIYGFCLYLCDRHDLFRIVAEGDRVLAEGGHLVIYDFLVNEPHRRIYHHDPRLVSFKMNYAALFYANPAY
ncbi:MAG: class I SAM-dependent methyltransferase, partial [Xanthobacteraceae bacterium]|nr:class I SAM-dependent methyltransferase [Xanthobacteraceae bacterium]